MSLATTWVDLEGITLGEISQAEKEEYCMVSLIYGILKKKKLTEKEIRFVVTEMEGGGGKLEESSQR